MCVIRWLGVGVLAGGIDDHEQVVVAARDHQVVEDAAALLVNRA
jgi:hypothetical protein